MRGTAVHLPTPVEWVLWDGSNFEEVAAFVREGNGEGAVEWQTNRNGGGELILHTREGDRWPKIGDRITRGLAMELYMIKPHLWGKLYGDVVTTSG